MKKLIKGLLLSSIGIAVSASAGTVEADIEKSVAPLLQGALIEKVEHSKRLSVYEIITDKGVFYTDKKGSYVLFGQAVDSKTNVDLTAARLNELGAFEFSKLPVADAIKTIKGDGSRKLVTLEDPNCGYCKKLAKELNRIDNVTIYTFLTPILSTESRDKSISIWCAKDREKTWHDYMLAGSVPTMSKGCDNPIDRNLALKSRLRVTGTPAILFEDNTRIPGYVAAGEIEGRFNEISSRKGK